MQPSLTASLHLPPGTVLSLDESRAALHLVWRSARGLHIIHSETSDVGKHPDFIAHLHAAAARFKLAVALEQLNEKLEELES